MAAAKPLPFVTRIMTAKLPEPFTMPDNNHLPRYDGKADAFDHVDSYLCYMNVWVASDEILCRVFPATLSGTALRWFWKLPEASISNFTQLSEAFLERFALTRVFPKNDDALYMMDGQREGESLKSWWDRFVAVAAEADHIEPGCIAPYQFIKGVNLENEEVWSRLEMSKIMSMRQLWEAVAVEFRIENSNEMLAYNSKNNSSAFDSDDNMPPPRMTTVRKRRWHGRRR